MSGRMQFSRYEKLINFIYFFVKFLPNSFQLIVLNFFDGYEGKPVLLLRYFYVRKNAALCGENIFIGKYVTLKNIDGLSLGSNISIQAYCYLDAFGKINIGDNVSIANHSSIISFEHTWSNENIPIKYNSIQKGTINISQDVWIGSGCRILSNTTINTRSVVAAGAVVNKDVDSNSIFGGIPARKIKEI